MSKHTYGVALDIGTTTLSAGLVSLPDGALSAVVSSVNRGRRFGADILSRLSAARSGDAARLQALLQEDADQLIARLLTEQGVEPTAVTRMAVAANTTMQHLLLGYNTAALGVAPFLPIETAPPTKNYPQIFGKDTLSCAVCFVPSASVFIGGDVVGGALTVEVSPPWLLIDLGTNGELLLHTGDRLLATSVAAGPAFEGACLSCGMAAVEGAVSRVRMRGFSPLCRTIGDKPPLGLCGSGAVEALYELRRAGLVDRSGTLHERYAEGFPLTDGVRLTQEDIRQLQMAKAAVRVGVDRLLEMASLPPSAVTAVLAGGFGAELDADRAKGIGLLPAEMPAVAGGNTALLGAARLVADRSLYDQARSLAHGIEVINLATDPRFEGEYMGNMSL